jgi:nucleoside triphosphate pyrophosphatase
VRVVLASASPIRLKVLRSAGLRPEVVVSGVDESAYDATTPEELATLLATAKAWAVAGRSESADALVIGCDSLLVLDGEALGKPGTAKNATARWKSMRGRSGVLVTGHCLIDVAEGREAQAAARTTVHFADISDEEIAAYVATGEPLQVAGAFTIEGYGGAFVSAIEGDHSNVLGISLPLLRQMTAGMGIAWTDLWAVQ